MQTVLIVVVILLLLGVIPLHGINPNLGYGAGGIGVVLLIVLLVLLLGGGR